MAKLTFYVQAVGQTYVWDSKKYLRNGGTLTLGGVTIGKPKRPVAEAKIVKVILNIPDSVFLADAPVVELDVPETAISGITGHVEDV